MTSNELKAILRQRHPAVVHGGGGPPILEAWTVIEEWEGIDLLACSSYQHPARGARGKRSSYPRVGYEVKVSRSDMRRELLRPWKRNIAKNLCHELYFAVPKGLLSEEELAFVEPEDWGVADFQRERCTRMCQPAKMMVADYERRGFKAQVGITLDALQGWIVCPECLGKKYLARSKVEREAPTLWIPRDVGLVEVGKVCRVVKHSPVTQPTPLSDEQIHSLMRWVSVRPDPRHKNVAREQRAAARRNTIIGRENRKENKRLLDEWAAKRAAEESASKSTMS